MSLLSTVPDGFKGMDAWVEPYNMIFVHLGERTVGWLVRLSLQMQVQWHQGLERWRENLHKTERWVNPLEVRHWYQEGCRSKAGSTSLAYLIGWLWKWFRPLSYAACISTDCDSHSKQIICLCISFPISSFGWNRRVRPCLRERFKSI